jgi:hypothetical protein
MYEIAASRITDIKECRPQNTYDIGVKDWHNFVLANGILSLNCVHTIFGS